MPASINNGLRCDVCRSRPKIKEPRGRTMPYRQQAVWSGEQARFNKSSPILSAANESEVFAETKRLCRAGEAVRTARPLRSEVWVVQ